MAGSMLMILLFLSIKMISRGMRVFFIQKPALFGFSLIKSMPLFSPNSFLNMRPSCLCFGVMASSSCISVPSGKMA